MKSNVRKKETTPGFTTHEGAPAVKPNARDELLRTVSCSMLFEDTFYESGLGIAKRIEKLCEDVSMEYLSEVAIRARGELRLRHAPLFLCVQMLKKSGTPEERNLVGETISQVIQRADELAEIFAIYWKEGRKALANQLKAGVAKAFPKFNAYQLAKYNRDGAVKLRDALFLSHPKPKDEEQAEIWKKLVDGTLEAPDTWEVALSAGKDKKETFERLIRENKLGYMALLRNLRNMEEAKVDREIVRQSLLSRVKGSKALPYRFIAAARFAPAYAQDVSDAMLEVLKEHPRVPGRTAIIVDTSGSMDAEITGKSKMKRSDAAAALAVLLREVTDTRVFAYADQIKEVGNYRGLSLVEAIHRTEVGWATYTGAAIRHVLAVFPDVERIFVVTDEQAHDEIPHLGDRRGYIINTAPYQPALPTKGGNYIRFSGFSERIIDWVLMEESEG